MGPYEVLEVLVAALPSTPGGKKAVGFDVAQISPYA